MRYADRLGALHPRLVAAHGVQVDAADREILARRGVHVVLCPRSNRNLGVGAADVPALLAAGVRLALGTDSLASAETLDVLDDAVLLHRQFPALDPAAIVRMATLGGAEALGFGDLGAIAPGEAGGPRLRAGAEASPPIPTSSCCPARPASSRWRLDDGRPRPGRRLRADDPLLPLGVRPALRPRPRPCSRRGRAASTARQVLWIVVAMVAARSAAMGFNRLADQAIDARNPRTAGRELPRGVLSRGEAWAFVAVSTAVFVLAAARAEPALPRPLAGRPR